MASKSKLALPEDYNLVFSFFGPQYDFIFDERQVLLYLGGVGAGKSLGIAAKSFLKCLEEPGIQGFITAPTYPLLRDSTLQAWWQLCSHSLVDWSAEEMVATFKHLGYRGGSRVMFRSTHDPDKLRGPNLGFVGMDEAAISSFEAYLILIGRIRQRGYHQQLFMGTTPQGFNWVYDEFNPKVLKADPDKGYFHCKTFENPYLDLKYIERLFRLYGGSENSFFKQEVMGEWVAAKGLVYPTFSTEVHTGHYPYNPDRKVILAIDFGFINPFAMLAIQEDARGRMFIVDEEYRMRTSDEEMVALLRTKPYWGNIATAICDSAEPDRIKRFQDLRIPAKAAKKGKIAEGIARMRELLAVDPVMQSPFILIDSSCEATIKEFGLYRYNDEKEERNTNEEPVDAYNHSLSAIRYYITTQYSRSASGVAKPPPAARKMGYQNL